jgi:hypothetical protein
LTAPAHLSFPPLLARLRSSTDYGSRRPSRSTDLYISTTLLWQVGPVDRRRGWRWEIPSSFFVRSLTCTCFVTTLSSSSLVSSLVGKAFGPVFTQFIADLLLVDVRVLARLQYCFFFRCQLGGCLSIMAWPVGGSVRRFIFASRNSRLRMYNGSFWCGGGWTDICSCHDTCGISNQRRQRVVGQPPTSGRNSPEFNSARCVDCRCVDTQPKGQFFHLKHGHTEAGISINGNFL